MMLLIGMKMSLTKNPMKPMIAKPTDVACAILVNSASKQQHAVLSTSSSQSSSVRRSFDSAQLKQSSAVLSNT